MPKRNEHIVVSEDNPKEIALVVGGPREGMEIRSNNKLLSNLALQMMYDVPLTLPSSGPSIKDIPRNIMYRLARFTLPSIYSSGCDYSYFYIPQEIPHSIEGHYIMDRLRRACTILVKVERKYPGITEEI